MKKIFYLIFPLLVACAQEISIDLVPEEEQNIIEADIVMPDDDDTKTALGEKSGKYYPNYWMAGDKISVNGKTSSPLAEDSPSVGTGKAIFTVTGSLSTPLKTVYPAAVVKAYNASSTSITLPATQYMSTESYDPAAFIMVGSSSQAGHIELHAVMSAIKLTVPGSYDAKISSVLFESLGGMKVSGPFTTNFSTISAASGATTRVHVYAPGDGISFGSSVYFLVPAQSYSGGMRFTVRATDGTEMSFKTTASFTATRGKVYTLTSPDYAPKAETIPDGLMVMSSNVRFSSGRDKETDPDTGDRDWTVRKTAFCAMVNYYRPAVIGLQEAQKEQVKDIKSGCSGYGHYGLGRDRGYDITADESGLFGGNNTYAREESSTILYRTDLISIGSKGTIWHSSSPNSTGSKFSEMDVPQTSTWAILTYKPTGQQFFFLNTHLSIYDCRPDEIALIMSTVNSKNTSHLPVIMTGDWNLEDGDSWLSPLTANGDNGPYYNARHWAQKADFEGTYHWWGTRSRVIDHIFYNGFGDCLLYKTDNRKWNDIYVSDHYAIYAVFDPSNTSGSQTIPTVDFDLPEEPQIDELSTFTDRSYSPAGIAYWEWDIDGIRSNEQNPTVTLKSVKDQAAVRLTIVDKNGKTASNVKYMNVDASDDAKLYQEWRRVYDDNSSAYAYWSSPAVNSAGDRIYVSSSGYHLVAYDASGTQKGSFDIGKYGAAISGDTNCQTCTPSIDFEGNIYIPVQYSYADGGNGGLFCLRPNMTEKWYVPTGEHSTYRNSIPAIFGDYVSVITRNVDTDLFTYNMVILKRSDGSLLQTLNCDKGSYGGFAVSADGKLVFASARGASDESSGGYKVGVIDGSYGSWKTSANSDAGRATNLLGMYHTDGYGYLTKGFQPAISTIDGSVYVCATTTNENMIVARYRLDNYIYGSAATCLWKVEVEAAANNYGLGCVLDDDGNAYVRAANKVFKLAASDGSLLWERETGTGNCGVPAIDNLGYVYVTDSGKRRMYKLSPIDGSLICQILFDNVQPRTSPTIDYHGNIYVTGTSINEEGAVLIKVTCPRTTGPGSNWSQLGGTPMKACVVPGATEVYDVSGSSHEGYTPVDIF